MPARISTVAVLEAAQSLAAQSLTAQNLTALISLQQDGNTLMSYST